jgi:asparagine synthase (glutamine-hydrolysing)
LYYLQDADRFVFASETKSLRKYATLKEINSRAVFHFLTEGIQLPGMELLKGIQEIQSHLVVDLNSMLCSEHKFEAKEEPPTEELSRVLEQVVESRLLSDVPLGFALSGGLDSAIVAGIARKKIKEATNLKLFSVVSEDSEADESYWQGLLAKEWQGQWFSVNTNTFSSDDLEKIIRATDMPPVAWNNIAQFELAALVKQHGVTVFLNGQGADEIFGGYPDYWIRFFRKHPVKIFSGWQLSMGKTELISAALKSSLKSLAGKSIRNRQFIKMQDGWLGEALWDNESWQWNRSHLNAEAAMREDFYGQRLRQMLRWEDLNGMANQLESRNPFADSQLLAKWLQIPLENKLTHGYGKGILRDAVVSVVPEDVRLRIDKKGFSVPDEKLTLKHMRQWKDAYFSDELNIYSPLKKREQIWKNNSLHQGNNLKWIFRLASLSYFLEQIKSE